MTPVEVRVLAVALAKAFKDPAQSPNVLASHQTDAIGPSLIAVLTRRRFGRDKRISPFEKNAPLLPIRFARELVPTADERLGCNVRNVGNVRTRRFGIGLFGLDRSL